MKKENKGISLIVLVITIIVIIILAGAVIVTLTNNNVIGTTNEAVFKSDVTSFIAELELYKSGRQLEEKGMFNPKTLFAKKAAGNVEGMEYKKIANIITNITANGYEDKFVVFEGKLIYAGDSKEEETWCLDNGISSLNPSGYIETTPDTTSINVVVNMMGLQSKLDQVTGFKWYIKEKNAANFDLKYTSTNKQDVSYTFTNLKSSTEYSIKVETVGLEMTINEKNVVTTVALSLLTSVAKAGDYVQYTGGEYSSWRVLHTNIDGQVQIVSKTSVKDVKLSESTDIVNAKNNYRNLVKILNDEAQMYINTSYADKARSLGSDPKNPRVNDTVDPGITDTNYVTDLGSMNNANMRLDKISWLASRGKRYDYFDGRLIDIDGSLQASALHSIWNGKEHAHTAEYGFAPVISLKSGIKVSGGDGSESKPWILVAM